jgi:hypothetical protein
MPIRSIFLAAAVAVGAANATAQEGVQKVTGYSQRAEMDRSYWVYSNGAFYASETLDRYPVPQPWRHRLVRVDALSGERTILSDPETADVGQPLFWTRTRFIAGSNYRLGLYALPSMEELTDIRLRNHVIDVMEKDDELLFLQTGYDDGPVLVRFDDEDLTYLGKTPLNHITGQFAFHDGGVIGIGVSQPCYRSGSCFSVSWLQLDGKLASQVEVTSEPDRNQRCGAEGVIAKTKGAVIVHVGCRYFAVNDRATRLLYEIKMDGPQSLDIAVSDELVFVRPMRQPGPANAAPETAPVWALDRRTGQKLAAFDLPQGKLETLDDKLILWPAMSRADIDVQIFRINARRLRQLAGAVGPRQ